jgi:hypothetical protein
MQGHNTSQTFMKKHRKGLQIILSVVIFFIPFFVLGKTSIPNPIPHDTLGELIHAIVSFIRNVALMIAPILFILAGLKYYFAGGNPAKANEATNMIKWTIIGLAIILVANGITAVIKDIMGVS